jgi:hypothetical protein
LPFKAHYNKSNSISKSTQKSATIGIRGRQGA